MGRAAHQPIDETVVRAALADVLAGEAFRDSPQLSAFLSFVVNETLAGRGDEIKGYSIATLALGRPSDFDPQADPIVRVQAGRVRQALAEHYATTQDSPVSIGLERGSYVPTFTIRATVPESPEDTSRASAPPEQIKPARTTAPSRRSVMVGGGIAAAAAAGAALLWTRREPLPSAHLRPAESYFPILRIEAEPSGSEEAARIAGRLRDAISRFDDLVMVADAESTDQRTPTRPNAAFDLQLRVTAASAGEGMVRPFLRLADRQDQRVIWSRELEPFPAGQPGDRAVSALVRANAAAIAQPYGLIHAHVRELLAAQSSQDNPFSCVVKSIDYWNTTTPESHLKARDCLAAQLSRYPNFGPLHAQMAYIHLEEHGKGYNRGPGDARTRALESARNAVLYRPESARAHQSLMAAYFVAGDLPSAWRAGTKALSINPLDTDILADMGSYRVMAGDFETGLAYLDQSVDLNPAPPAWVITYRAMALYLLGRLEFSGPMATTLEGSNYVLAQIALIMASFQFRDRERGQRNLEIFRKAHPDAAKDVPALLRRMNFQEPVIAQIMKDYDRAMAWLNGG